MLGASQLYDTTSICEGQEETNISVELLLETHYENIVYPQHCLVRLYKLFSSDIETYCLKK